MIDELSAIARYMTAEMNANAQGDDCRRMARLNSASGQDCIAEYLAAPWWRRWVQLSPEQCVSLSLTSRAAALLAWTQKVMQNGDWDHKPKIARRFRSASTKTYAWHTHGSVDYFYDVWSNVHYGYVGRAAGFSESVLLDGAGLEQIGTEIIALRFPKSSGHVVGLRRFDGTADRAAITLGVRLHGAFPRGLPAHILLGRVLAIASLTTRPHKEGWR